MFAPTLVTEILFALEKGYMGEGITVPLCESCSTKYHAVVLKRRDY